MAAIAAAVAGLHGRGVRCLSGMHRPVVRVPWPDVRLWVRHLPDGTATIEQQRGDGAAIAFDVYSRGVPGTREVRLGGLRFFAFTAPRYGAEHLVVWRRTEDVCAAAGQGEDARREAGTIENKLEAAYPLRLTSREERAQLTAPVWCWDDLSQRDPGRYWDDGSGAGQWMYWESFWAPADDASLATAGPAFGDPAGEMLAPLLGTAVHRQPAPQVDFGSQLQEATQADEGGVVTSTATATAAKDQAYSIVYQFNVWGSDVSRSGTGSDLWSPEARLAVTALEAVVDHLGVRSILDCACGDATWMVPYFVSRHPELEYCGVDIVPDVIKQNKQRHPELQFLALDLAEMPLPVGADLVFSKETLNHMGVEDAQNALRRFRATGARYLLTNVHEGSDNELGRNKACFTTYIKYDYELPPFGLKKLASVIEYQGPMTSFSLFALDPL